MLRDLLKRALAFASGEGKVNLAHAFGLPPEKAIRYFESKGFAISWDWHDTYQEAHNKAFTVAKVTRMDILEDIRAAVGEIFTEGVTERDFSRRLEPKLKAKGWWGRQRVLNPQGEEQTVTLGTPHRLRTIYRTNAQVAMNAGRWKQFAENADKRPYLEYVAVLDSRTRPGHRVLHGKVFRIDDPIWRTMAPPNGWGCRCRLRAWSLEDLVEDGKKLSRSDGALSQEQRVVSERTGELKPVTVYTDPKTGQRVATDPGFDYNPGNSDFDAQAKKRSPDIVKKHDQVVKARGLAVRYPVRFDKDIETLLRAFDRENPGIFQLGFREAKVTRSKSMMAATSRDGSILISNQTFSDNLVPTRDFKSAMQKVAKGEALSFNEEYSVEIIWHEIGHCRSKGWVSQIGRPAHITQVMETLNQWVARHTYPEFLEALGAKPRHQEQILAQGLGYATWIRNFRSLLRVLGVEEKTALGMLRPLAVESSWYDLPNHISEKLAGFLGGSDKREKIKRALINLDIRNEARFQSLAEEILK